MTCPDDNALWALADGALADGERPAVEAHLDVCAACRAALAALLRLQDPSPRAATPVRTRGATLGRYVIVDAVGAGGMGVVYRAFDPELDRKIALKLVRTAGVRDQARLRERLTREARLLARISHPNVVPIYDVGVVGDEVFLAMEFVAGPTLAAWQRAAPRPWPDVLDLYLQAARGLAQAHAVGVVHRDFKPSNALIGPDGRVRVVDFGLARTDDPDLTRGTGPEGHVLMAMADGTGPGGQGLPDMSHGPAGASALTSHGVVAGTPAYMAPEQRVGRPADARSDQYSLCLALHEALLGAGPTPPGPTVPPTMLPTTPANASPTTARPGGPTTLARPDVAAAEPRRIPRWLRRVLQRGLQADPAARWPDMHALVAACERGRRGGAGRVALAAAAALGLVALGVRAATPAAPASPLCQGAAAELAGVWDADTRAAIAPRFAAAGPRYAAATWTTAAAALDANARAWTDAHARVCEATRVYGHQSEADMARRMRCLDDRRADLQQTAQLLARADPDVVERAVTIAYALPDPAACVLRSADDVADRDDPAVRHVRDRIAGAAALVHAARYADARALLGDALEVAAARDWPALVADGQSTLAEALEQIGEPAAAEDALYRAVWAAEAARDDARTARAWLRMAPLLAEKLARPAEARRAAEHARAALARRGPDPALTFALRVGEATVAVAEGRFAAAQEGLAAALADAPFAADDPRRIEPLGDHGVSFYLLGEHEAAAARYRDALAIAGPSLGVDHPTVGDLHNNLGNALAAQGDLDGAEAEQRAALAIYRDSLGPGHPSTAGALANLANLAVMRDAPELAVPQYREALAILAALPTPHPDEARIAYNFGACQIRQKDPAGALRSFQRAAAVQRRSNRPDHPDLAAYLTGVGIAQVERGDPDAGIAPLEEAVQILVAAPRDPLYLAQARFELARALWNSRADRPRARALAQQARETYRANPHGERFLKEVEAWLAAPG